MSNVPTNLIPTRVTGLPEYLGSSTLGYMPYIIDGRSYKVQFANIAAVGAVPSSREINTGSGLGGGGDLSANRTLFILPGGVDDSRLTTTGVAAGTYGAADSIPVFTVNAQGRVTGVTDTPIVLSNYVPTSRTITAGAGLTGGGDLSANRSFAVIFSSTTPEPLGPGSPGVSTVAARGDHVHPAVDLSDTTETQGVLPLSRGGTGNSLSPVVGAIAYSSNDALYLTPTSGNAGDVLVSGGGVAPPFWQAPIGGGTVTSINASGGTTGMSFTGGPVTTIGTLTLGGTLGVANGGTGATSAATALTNLGAYPASNPAGYTSNVGTVTSVSGTGTVSGLSLSGTVTSAGSLTLGGTLAVTPSDFASQSANTVLAAPNGSAGVPTFRAIVAADIPTLNQNTTGTAGNVSGIVAVANGGTGASVAGTARTNLGAAASGANTDITSIALTTGTVSATPTGGTDLVNKAYADSIASGINFHQSVRLATAAALPANTYNNGSSGVGATLTANANGALTVDGVAAVAGNRILVKNEVAQANNGVYTVTQVGDGSTPYILTRATDFDSAGTGVDQIDAGDFFLVTAGSTQSNTSWVQQTPLPITVGTTALVFTQFAAPVLYSAGTGLTLAGTVFSITNTGVSASTYGSASSVPVLAINAQGQITSASASSIAIAASQVTSGTFTVAQGGTGATTLGANGVLLGNGTSAISATAVGATGQVLVGNTGAAPTWATLSGIGVTSLSGGTTGLTPASATTGAITLAGTLNVANGGTGTATAFTAGSVVFAGASGVYTQDNANLFWDNTNGRLGIGTSSPEGVFHVQYTGGGAAIVRRYSTDANAANVNLQKSRGTSASPTIVASGDIIGNLSFQGYDGSAFRTAAAIYGEVDGTPGSTDMPGRLTFLTSLDGSATPTERMRITNAGYVGIGTSAPSSSQILTLSSSGTATPANGGLAGLGIINTDVTASGTTGILGNLTDPGGTGRHAGAIAFGKDGTWTTGSAYPGNIQFWTRPNSTASEAERMRIDSSGNVGIGTSSPAYRLDVNGVTRLGAGSPAILAGVGGAFVGGQGELYTVSTNTMGLGTTGAASMQLYTNSTERMRIDASGNVGIGTSSPDIFGRSYTRTVGINSSGTTMLQINGTTYGGIDLGFNGTRTANILAETAGFYLQTVGAVPMVFTTNGSERMRIDSSGNVGIGTSSPSSLLHIKRGSNATEVYPSGTWASRIINATDASGENGLVVGNRWAAPSSTVFEVGSIFGGGGGSWYSYYKVDGVGNSIWSNGGTEVMRLAGSNLGIGTTSPASKLDVRGVITGGDGTIQTVISYLAAAGVTGTLSNHPYVLYANNAERMRIDSSGNVGIGTSAPSSRLTITGGITEIRDGNYLMLRPSGNAWDMRLQATGTQLDILSGGSLGSPIMSLLNGGNVGIGTSTPATKLEVNGGLIAGAENRQSHPPTGPVGFKAQWNFTGGDGETDFYNLYALGTTSFRFYQSTGSGTAQLLYNMRPSSHEFYTGGTERMRINSSGFLLVGTTAPLGGNTSNEFKTTTAGSWPLTINSNDRGILHRQSSGTTGFYEYFEYNGGTNNGSISYSGGTTAYNTTSDYRLKKIDGPITNSGAYIDALNPVQGIWKADGTRFVGLVAHEVQEVSSTPVVTGEKDGEMMQQMDYSSPEIIANLIAEVQSLRARVAQLEGN